MRNVVADTGFFVALFDRSDQYHDTAVRVLRNTKARYVSTAAAATETTHLLSFDIDHQMKFLTWIRDGGCAILPITEVDMEEIIGLTLKYADLPMDFADATLVTIGNQHGIRHIATFDQDFDIYRLRNGRRFRNIIDY